MDLKTILKNNVYSSNLSNLVISKKCIINTINPHSYCVAKNDLVFLNALLSSDILLPDGSGIVLAARILTDKKINKIAGSDIHLHLLEEANLNHNRIFYLGSTNSTLELIKIRISKEFPNIVVSYYSPPYKEYLSEEDTAAIISAVNKFAPNILFVGMTAPKQEKWVYQNKDKLNSNVITSIGAVFDFYAGTIKRPNKIWIKFGLEWFPRFLKEPKRLWRRNFISTPMFLWEVFKEKINGN